MSQDRTHPAQVFLSHTKTDKEFVRRLAGDLDALGFKVWFDEWELRVGDSLVGTIEKAIDESAWMIAHMPILVSWAGASTAWRSLFRPANPASWVKHRAKVHRIPPSRSIFRPLALFACYR